jgi:hypothetical protein
MEQTQTLPFDKGDSPGLYNPYSWAGTLRSMPELPYESTLRDKYNHYRNEAVQVYPLTPFVGQQAFESSERPRPYYNECINVKTYGFNYPFGISQRAYVGTMCYLTPYSRIALPSSIYLSYVLAWETERVAYEEHDSSSRRAWWNMQPRFEGRVQLLNSIFELKDFADIAKVVVRFPYRNWRDGLISLRRIVHRAAKDNGIIPDEVTLGMLPTLLKRFDWTTRGLAALYLTKRLAIDPTIADALAIHEQMGRLVKEEQEKFQKKGLLQSRSHFKEVLYKDHSETVGGTNGYWRKLLKQRKVTFNASMEYTYDYKMRNPIKAFTRYWGLDLNSHVVWNGLKLSWLVDYICTISDSIDTMNRDPNVDLLPLQYCESILSEAKAGYYTTGDSRAFWHCVNGIMVPGSQADVALSGYEFSSYKRSVVEPNRGSSLPQLKWPSTGQLKVVAALLRCWI